MHDERTDPSHPGPDAHHSPVGPDPASRLGSLGLLDASVVAAVDAASGDVPILHPLLDEVPEFIPAYLAMATACGDEPGEPSVLMGLADFVAELMATARRERPPVERILTVIESHLESIADDEEGSDVVAFAFFDSLDPELRNALARLAGPLSRVLIDDLDGRTPPEDF